MNTNELFSRFVSSEKIKKGGQKIVYKVKNESGEIYALKIILNANDQRVLQEINLLKGLNIDNIPNIIENGLAFDNELQEEVLYIIEDYIEGISVRDWLSMGNVADLQLAYKILNTLLEIELQLEKQNILHRDINPNNIIMGNDGMIYLIDFGLAKIIGGSSITKTSASLGPFTPGYAPSEQFCNEKLKQDVRTDLFQIGVTVYECCTGKNPFINSEDNIVQVLFRTVTVIPTSLTLKGDDKGMFSMLIKMLMSKNQSQRPDTAVDAMRYLQAAAETLDFGG